MKKKTLLFLLLGVVVYAAVIWFVRSNQTARAVAKWVCGIVLGVWGLDWLLGQFAGLISETLQEKMVAVFMGMCVAVIALVPLFVAAIIR